MSRFENLAYRDASRRYLKLVIKFRRRWKASLVESNLRDVMGHWMAYIDGDVWIRRWPWSRKIRIFFHESIPINTLFEQLYVSGAAMR